MSARRTDSNRPDASRSLALALGGLVLVAVLPLVLLASGVAWLVVQQRQDVMAGELQGTARALQVAVDRALYSTVPAMQLLVSDKSTAELIASVQSRAGRALQSSPDWLDVMLVDPAQQRVLAHRQPGAAPELSAEARAAIGLLMAGQSPQFTGVQRMGDVTGRLALLAHRPLGDATAAPLVIMVALNPLPLSAVFADQHLAERWTGAILDPNLRLAGRSRDASQLMGKPATVTLASRIEASAQGMFMAVNQEGEPVYTAFSRSPATGWSVALGVPSDEVQGPINKLLRQLALGGGLLVGLALLMAGLVGHGIVRRRRAYEQALQQSEARLSLSLAGSELATWDWHLPSGVLNCSDAWSSMLGQGPDALPVHIDTWRSRIHPDDLPGSQAVLAEHLAGRSAMYEVEYRVRRTDGAWIWALVRGKVVAWLPDGRPERLTGTALDVSQRRAEQLAAEQDHARLRAILATVREGIHIINRDGLLVEANPAFLAMLGLDASALGRLHVSDWDPDATAENFGRRGAVAAQHGQSRLFEARHRRSDGVLLPVELSVSQVEVHGEVLTCTASRDITQRKHHEADMAQHQQHLEALVVSRTAELAAARDAAEAANRAKSVFLANMSHELRTPLAGTMGMTELALRRATDARQIEQLNKSLSAARHLMGVISDVLDISRIEANHLHLQAEDFSPAALVEDTLRLLEPSAQAKGLRLRAELADGLPERLCGDVGRLRQILLNLVGNAVKFSEQGTVVVRAELTEPLAVAVAVPEANPKAAGSGSGSGSGPTGEGPVWFKLSVSDQGIGITPQALAQLFRPFVQADASSTRRHDGAGLGLVISRRLAELMHGTVGVHSIQGQGSTFWATVKLAKAAAPAAPAGAKASAEQMLAQRFAGSRVLLAEDNPISREVTAGLLAQAGLVVDLAHDGEDALAQALGGGHALILMDVQMPRLSGLQATQALRQLPGLQSVPVLAMTARAFAADRAQCLAAGMDDHLAKPFEPEQLYALVLAWLASGRRPGTGAATASATAATAKPSAA